MKINNISIFTHSPSGLNVILEKVYHSEIIHCGMMINVGSRDENILNNGISHFIEHTVFKGTKNKSSSYIIKSIEDIGGEINAFTSREKTCYHTSTTKKYLNRSIDILTDITFNALFPIKEIEKEKTVIFDEIDIYSDCPDDSISDEFYENLFNTHPLGYNILGKKETLFNINKNDVETFINKNYNLNNTILSIVGNTTEEQILKILDNCFINYPSSVLSNSKNNRTAPIPNTPFHIEIENEFTQAHCIIGGVSYSKHDHKRFAFNLLNGYLGGPRMSSRLNLTVRERYGLTYSISSSFNTYQDTGTFIIYFGCDNKNIKKCKKIIQTELDRLCQNKMSDKLLQTIKDQNLGQITLSHDNYLTTMINNAENYLDYDKHISFNELKETIQEVTIDDILLTAQENLNSLKLSNLTYYSI
jgi:predicted Zn-dependent peptidase